MKAINRTSPMWICIGPNGLPVLYTISFLKKTSIRKMLEGTSLSWREFKIKYGYTCRKCEIIVKEYKKSES